MSPSTSQPGSREVEPRKRNRKRSASELRRKASRLRKQMEDAADSRAAAWAEREANTVAKHTTDLTVMHGAKREMRRDVYRAAPALEGQPVRRPQPRPGS